MVQILEQSASIDQVLGDLLCTSASAPNLLPHGPRHVFELSLSFRLRLSGRLHLPAQLFDSVLRYQVSAFLLGIAAVTERWGSLSSAFRHFF